jgi:NADH:ubiquinone oxidoreductase subunit 6 (subunit J)
MTIERVVFAFAGFMVMLSLGLGVEASPIFHNGLWLWLTAFVGANLFQYAFSGFCPLAMVLKAMGVRSAAQ